MSINNVNQQTDIQKLLKAMKSAHAVKTQASKLPSWMKMDGSIFSKDAQMISNNNATVKTARRSFNMTASNVQSVNTTRSVEDVSSETTPVHNSKHSKPSDNGSDNIDLNIDFDNLHNMGEGDLKKLRSELKELRQSNLPRFLDNSIGEKLKKIDTEIGNRSVNDGNKLSVDNKEAEEKSNAEKTGEAESSSAEAKSGTAQTNQGTQKMNMASSQMRTLDNDTQSGTKKIQKTMKSTRAMVNSSTQAMQKEVKKMELANAENERLSAQTANMNARIESLSTNPDESSSSEIENLQTQIEVNQSKVSANQQTQTTGQAKLKRIQTRTNKHIRTLSRSAKAFRSTQMANIQTINTEQQNSNKILDVANKVNEYSSMTATIGTGVFYTGVALSHTAWGGAVGGHMMVVGKTAETAGNAGVAASNITKAAVYTAQGNIMGALTSAGMAVVSGATAMKGGKELQAAFKGAGGNLMKMGEQFASGAVDEAMKEAGKKGAQEVTGDAAKQGAKKGFLDSVDDYVKLGTSAMSVGSMFQSKNPENTVTSPITSQNGNSRLMASRRRRLA